jgi:hypothetical protein
MKTLNESLREEFQNALSSQSVKEKISQDKLEIDILNKAFEVLLDHKYNSQSVERARGDFENFLINKLKSKTI